MVTNIWASANLEAFSQLPWDTRDKNIIMEAAKNVIDVARIPVHIFLNVK